MQGKEHPYRKEQLRTSVALRMIAYEARTCTIRACTGLSDDQIRRLYRHYVSAELKSSIKRHRGKSPRQLAYFTRNAGAQLESSMLATALASYGLLHANPGRSSRETPLEYGARFCDAYAAYRRLPRVGQLSFEHAWFFRNALLSGNELGLDRCKQCAGLYVSDVFSIDVRGCPLCRASLRQSYAGSPTQPSGAYAHPPHVDFERLLPAIS